MWQSFFSALALMLVFEGMMPFLSPDGWRRVLRSVTDNNDRAIRVLGLVSMLCGLALLTYVRHT